MTKRILIIDDEPSICITLAMALNKKYNADYALNANDGLALLKTKEYHLVLLDLKIGSVDGVDVLRQIKAHNKNIAVIMITAFGSIDSTVEAMRAGAYTYMTKPLRIEEMLIHVEQALRLIELEDRISYLNSELESQYSCYGMIGKSTEMAKILSLIDKIKDSNVSVLISGESGVGKELVARATHYSGVRKNKKFIAVNCAAIPENLLEDELFGHVQGAYTGAISNRKGRFEQADGGTIFLDEIGDMPLLLQGKILRVLQEKRFFPVGSEDYKETDVRVVAATNRDLKSMVEAGKFRMDLYYRLNVVEISIPPLRERREDIPLLCKHFIEKYNKEHNRNVSGISKEVGKILLDYNYPGNIRQLANILEYAIIVCDEDTINTCDLPKELRTVEEDTIKTNLIGLGQDENIIDITDLSLREIEKVVILKRLKENDGHQRNTAKKLGINERTLRNKIKEYINVNKR